MGDIADDVFDSMLEQERLHISGQCDDWCPLCQYDDEAEAELDEFYYDDHEGGW